MRRLLSVICCLTLCVLCICPTVTALKEMYPIQHRQGGFYYWVYENGTVVIKDGIETGDELVIPTSVEYYEYMRSVDWVKIRSDQEISPEKVVISEGITSIQELYWAENRVAELELPNGLKNIGHQALEGCTNLQTLTIPATVVTIGNRAIPENVTLRVETGSYAARWAAANGYTFEEITPPRSVGDVNDDGAVNSTDARLILQYFVNKADEETFDKEFADIDGSGEVDSTDARLALQYFVGTEKPEAITAPIIRQFNGWIDPAQVESVYAVKYGPRPNRPEREGEVDDPKATVEALNEYVSSEYTWQTSNGSAAWRITVRMRDGSIQNVSSSGFTYGGTSYAWEGDCPPLWAE